MRGIWHSKLLFWNFVALFIIKGALLPSFQFADLLNNIPVFSAQEIITKTNAARISNGIKGLKESVVLDVAAAQKLDDMARNGYFAHFSPSGTSPWHWFQVNGYRYAYAGENLAIGFIDAQSTVDAWLQSSSHRRNVLSSSFQEIGVAVARVNIGNDNGIVVVQLFGTPTSIPGISFFQSDAKQNVEVILSQSDAGNEPSTPTPKLPATELHPVQPPIAISTLPRTTSIQERSFGSVIVRILNSSFTTYAYMLVILSLGYLLFREFRKELVYKFALHLLLFALAVAIPLLSNSPVMRIG